MLGKKVCDFMLDTEDNLMKKQLAKALVDGTDNCFEYYYSPKDRWC